MLLMCWEECGSEGPSPSHTCPRSNDHLKEPSASKIFERQSKEEEILEEERAISGPSDVVGSVEAGGS